MPKKRKVKKNNFKIGIIFSAIIVLLISLSLVGKFASLVNQSKYDDKYPFYLEVESNHGAQFLSFFPKQQKISLLNVGSKTKSSSVIPKEAAISADSLKVEPGNIPSFFLSLFGNKKIKTTLTAIDMTRLYLFSKTVDREDITIRNIDSLQNAAVDEIVIALFHDPVIESEGLRVQVVNATGDYGVGNKTARLLTGMGVNVVFVSTADRNEKESAVYYAGDKTYTVERLARVLGYKTAEIKQKTIADIMIQLGEDSR